MLKTAEMIELGDTRSYLFNLLDENESLLKRAVQKIIAVSNCELKYGIAIFIDTLAKDKGFKAQAERLLVDNSAVSLDHLFTRGCSINIERKSGIEKLLKVVDIISIINNDFLRDFSEFYFRRFLELPECAEIRVKYRETYLAESIYRLVIKEYRSIKLADCNNRVQGYAVEILSQLIHINVKNYQKKLRLLGSEVYRVNNYWDVSLYFLIRLHTLFKNTDTTSLVTLKRGVMEKIIVMLNDATIPISKIEEAFHLGRIYSDSELTPEILREVKLERIKSRYVYIGRTGLTDDKLLSMSALDLARTNYEIKVELIKRGIV